MEAWLHVKPEELEALRQRIRTFEARERKLFKCSACLCRPGDEGWEWCAVDSSYVDGHVVRGSIDDVCGPVVLTP